MCVCVLINERERECTIFTIYIYRERGSESARARERASERASESESESEDYLKEFKEFYLRCKYFIIFHKHLFTS